MICVIIFYQEVLKDQKLDFIMQGMYHFVLIISKLSQCFNVIFMFYKIYVLYLETEEMGP